MRTLYLHVQLPTFFQTPSPSSKGFIRTLESVFVNWDKINWVSVIFGTAAVVIYLSLNFANKKFKAKQVGQVYLYVQRRERERCIYMHAPPYCSTLFSEMGNEFVILNCGWLQFVLLNLFV